MRTASIDQEKHCILTIHLNTYLLAEGIFVFSSKLRSIVMIFNLIEEQTAEKIYSYKRSVHFDFSFMPFCCLVPSISFLLSAQTISSITIHSKNYIAFMDNNKVHPIPILISNSFDDVI